MILARTKTNIKQFVLLPLKNMLTDPDFLMRIAIFGSCMAGIVYFTNLRKDQGYELGVVYSEGDEHNKYSKMLGKDKKLDKVLEKLNSEPQKAQVTMDQVLAEQ